MISIRPQEFFRQLALNSGVSDLKVVQNFYYGLVRTISKELKSRQVITLPDLGTFSIRIRKSRNTLNVNTGNIITLPAMPELKFLTNKNLKKYFQSLAK